MQRFRPSSRPDTLSHKVKTILDEKRYMPPSERSLVVHLSASLGMDEDARGALDRLLRLAEKRKTGIAGYFMPDPGVSAILEKHGIAEQVEEADFFRYQRVVIPYGGISQKSRKEWEDAGFELEDLTSPQVRRAQVALGLLRMEGAQGLVIGRHDDPESLALAGGGTGTRIIEDTTDTARLSFSPAFGVVCQTTLSPRRVSWLVQQLRFRYRDSRVTFLDTVCPFMTAREEALEKLLVTCDRAIIVGKPGEASCEALAETAMRRGKTAVIISSAEDLKPDELTSGARVALTAGAFATDDAIRGVAGALAGW